MVGIAKLVPLLLLISCAARGVLGGENNNGAGRRRLRKGRGIIDANRFPVQNQRKRKLHKSGGKGGKGSSSSSRDDRYEPPTTSPPLYYYQEECEEEDPDNLYVRSRSGKGGKGSRRYSKSKSGSKSKSKNSSGSKSRSRLYPTKKCVTAAPTVAGPESMVNATAGPTQAPSIAGTADLVPDEVTTDPLEPGTNPPTTPPGDTLAPTVAQSMEVGAETAQPTQATGPVEETAQPTPPADETAQPTPPVEETAQPTQAEGTTTAPSSAAMDATSAPTVGGTTEGGPLNIRIVVEDSSMEYGFFPEATVREPTQEEYDGIIEQEILFFNEVLATIWPNFVSFEHENLETSYDPDPGATYPVQIDFDAVANFEDGSPVPTIRELFNALQAANLNDYIQRFAWEAEPNGESIFFETQRVRYDAAISSTESEI